VNQANELVFMGVGKIISRGSIMDFSRGSQKYFSREGKKW